MKKKIYDIVFAAQYEGLSTKEATDQLLVLFGVVGRNEQLKCEHKGRRTATELVEYCEDCKKILFHP